MYQDTLESALNYAKEGRIEEWIHSYLLTKGKNKGLSDGLKLHPRYFIGPIKMPRKLFTRCCGPEKCMKWVVEEEGFERKVAHLQQVIERKEDVPPLIVEYVDNAFVLNDGSHRFEAYTRLGIESVDVIVWATEEKEYEMFLEKYGTYVYQQ